MKKTLVALSALLLTCPAWAQIKLDVDAGTRVATVTKLFNGTNIEDLNNQTNGGSGGAPG